MSISTWLGAAAVACALVAAPAVAGDDGSKASAVKAAQAVIATARKATKGDADTKKALNAARAAMEPFAADVRAAHWDKAKGERDPQFAMTWNDLATVCAYHGVAGKSPYALDKSLILWNRYFLGLPTVNAWSWEYNTDKKNNDQLHMFINQKRPNGQKLRQIKVWTYRWDTVYSGVGGENYKGLAKMMFDVDHDSTASKGRKVSPGIVTKRLNSEFDRAYYYMVEGLDVDEEKRLHRDNYYVKGRNVSLNFEIISYLDPTPGDDEVTKWQCGEGDPEIAAVLESLSHNPEDKTK